MELGIREWLIIIGAVLLAFVLLDGIRRMRAERRNHIRVAFRMGGGVSNSDRYVDPVDREVGEARVIGKEFAETETAEQSAGASIEASNAKRGFQAASGVAQSTKNSRQSKRSAADADHKQGQLGFDNSAHPQAAPPQKVSFPSRAKEAEQDRIEPSIGELADFTGSSSEQRSSLAGDTAVNVPAEDSIHGDGLAANELQINQSSTQAQNIEDFQEAASRIENNRRHSANSSRKEAQAEQSQVDEEIVAVYVLSRHEAGFNGADLLQVLLACDLRFGRGNIFHRHEYENGTGPVQFSMANLIEPGTFDLNTIESFQTPGVCFFMRMDRPEDPMQAFDLMIGTANCIVRNLDGELRDEANSTMTQQTMEHYRHNVQEFERRQLTATV